ncbi:MAG TPA: pyruvate dehydrogenase complex dihydrolipoamide acetyltransferase [Gemmatimonadaceae bacterium]|nr:pyruvate dehydrogenase complex dihydrolipoamide acetyltransferase [Gemmatimonadaceae bacterium]
MATKVFMEALSPTMEEGRLVKWLKNEGDAVKSGEPLGEVETDKAIMELVARGDGVLRKRLVNEGDAVPVGTLVGVIAAKDENIDALVSGAAAAPAAAGAAAAPAAPAPAANAQQSTGPSQAAPAAPPQRPAQQVPPSPPQPAPAAAQPAASGNGEHVRSSPLARRLATERGVNLGSVQGSGPGGRIIKRDIEAAATSGAPAGAVATPSRPSVVPSSRPSFEGDYKDVPLTQIRKIIAKRLGESIGPIPTFYLTAELDLTRVMEMRGAMAELGDEYKVSVNDVLLKAIAVALSQHPEVNAHWLGDHIRYFNRVHLGMAVATDDGLIVPVIWDADTKGLATISREAKELAKRARERKLKPEEFTGSTFSVSNLGMFGIDQFTAIINPPEAGIIAIGTGEDKLVVVDGEPVVRKRVRLTMSCDHRIIDGAVGAKFLQTLRRLVENPLMLVY